MTPEQIQTFRMEPYGVDYRPLWLKEIAYQIAVMNERNVERDSHESENRVLEFQAMIATMGGIQIPPQGPPYLPITPGSNSHTYHYTLDPDQKAESNSHTGSQP